MHSARSRLTRLMMSGLVAALMFTTGFVVLPAFLRCLFAPVHHAASGGGR